MEERKEERKAIKRATEEGSKISRVRRVIKPEEKLAVKLMEGERERESENRDYTFAIKSG